MQADLDLERQDRIRLDHAFFEAEALKDVPGIHWHGKGKDYWSLPLALPSLYALKSTFPNLGVSEALVGWVNDQFELWVQGVRTLKANPLGVTDTTGVRPELIERLKMFNDSLVDRPVDLKMFQEVAALALPTAEGMILADGMGAGKTIEAIAALEVGDGYPALVIVPKSVLGNWAYEFARWAPHRSVTVLDGTPAVRRKALAKWSGDVMLTTYDILKAHSKAASYGNHALKRCEECGGSPGEVTAARCEAHVKELNGIGWMTVIADEAHRLMDPTSGQTRTVWGVSKNAVYRWALTGTPTESHPGQLWPILHFIAPDEWPSMVAYRERYCHQVQNFWGGIEIIGLRPDRIKEFRKATDVRILRRPKELILPELPPKIYVTRHIDLDTAERKTYDEFKIKLITELDSGTLFAASPLTAVLRLAQMAGGRIDIDKTEGTGKVVFTGKSSLLDEVDEIVAEMAPDPVVVYFVNVGLLKFCRDRLVKDGHSVGAIYGEVESLDRIKIVNDFQNGKSNVFLGTYAAASEGITLARAGTMIRAQRPWSSLLDSQAADRVHRIGSEGHESITYIDIIVNKTITESIPGVLENKGDNLEAILRDEEQLRRLLS